MADFPQPTLIEDARSLLLTSVDALRVQPNDGNHYQVPVFVMHRILAGLATVRAILRQLADGEVQTAAEPAAAPEVSTPPARRSRRYAPRGDRTRKPKH